MYKRSALEKVFNVFNILFFTVFCFTTLYPFINLLAISLNDGIDTASGGITFIPRVFTLENIMAAVKYPAILDAAMVSMGRTVIGTIYHLVIVMLAAYALSKKNLVFKKSMLVFLTIPMFISGGLVPAYINFGMLKLIDKFWIYVIPGGFSFFNCIVIRAYIQTIPASLEESAFIDGSGYFQIFVRIIFPLSLPVIAAIALFTAVGHWNDWWTTMIFISDQKLYTLQYVLQQILKENMTQEILNFNDYIMQEEKLKRITPKSIQAAILMVTTLPILVVYPFLQKYFVKGMMIGSLKE